MIEKIFQLHTPDYYVLNHEHGLEKTAGVDQYHPEIREFSASLRPRSGYSYVLVCAMGAGEFYGCFPEGTLIRTALGDAPIESVEIGQHVLTHQNRLGQVTSRQEHWHEGELVDLYLQGMPHLFPALTATPNHELWVVPKEELIRKRRRVVYKGDTSIPLEDRRGTLLDELEFDWVSIEDLQRGDLVAQPFPLQEDPHALADYNQQEATWGHLGIAFLMGLYAAEGCLSYRKDRDPESPYTTIFVLSFEEGFVAEEICRIATLFGHEAHVEPDPETHSIRVELCWKDFAILCRDHVGTHSTSKRLSSQLLVMPYSWQEAFFRSYVGGDFTPSGDTRCTSASAGLLTDLRLLLARLGILSSVSGRHNRKATWYNGNPIFELLVGRSQESEQSQSKSLLHPAGYILTPVARTERYEWAGRVFDLQVEGDSSYTASGISVHNSNINGDHFPVKALSHEPEGWSDLPLSQRAAAGRSYFEDEGWGYTTFYGARVFKHHKNKPTDPSFGIIVLAVWNDVMKRVELIHELNHADAAAMGAMDIVNGLDNGKMLDLSMGCFVAGTLVTMADGTRKPIEDVVVGDLVITHKGRSRRVTKVHRRQYNDPLISIRAEAHETLQTTVQHPFLGYQREQVKSGPRWLNTPAGQPDWIHASCLDDEIHLVEPVIEDTLTPDYVDRSFARLFGYYLAEGHVLRNKQKEIVGIELSTHVDDPVHEEISDLCEKFGTKNPPSWHDRENSEVSCGIYIFDERLAQLCYQHGGGYAERKKLSYEALRWDPEMQREILGAYANGDGCGLVTGALNLSTASTDLAWQWMSLLPRLGIVASIQNLEHKAGSGFSEHATYEWVIYIGKQWAQSLLDVCSKIVPVELLRSKNSRKIMGGEIVTPIREIEVEQQFSDSRKPVEVFNLEVEEDESYLAAGLAVHNCKVPFDTCSICLDWDRYTEALASFDPRIHKNPAKAVLAYHRRRPIRGLAITRADYCEHALGMMNKILPDGRKVFVYNDFPRFFDDSYVIIGADRISKSMAKLAEVAIEQPGKRYFCYTPSGSHGEARRITGMEKVSSVREKASSMKQAEIEKEVEDPSYKACNLLSQVEPELPQNVTDALGSVSLPQACSTAGQLGIVLRPTEFQRVYFSSMGKPEVADLLDQHKAVFKMGEEPGGPMPMGPEFVNDLLKKVLMGSSFDDRSCFDLPIRRRFVKITIMKELPPVTPDREEVGGPDLQKVSAAYSAYRLALLEKAPEFAKAASRDPGIVQKIYGGDALLDHFGTEKKAGVGLALLATIIPLTYMIAAHFRQKMEEGETINPAAKFLANNPFLSSALIAGGAKAVLESGVARGAVAALAERALPVLAGAIAKI